MTTLERVMQACKEHEVAIPAAGRRDAYCLAIQIEHLEKVLRDCGLDLRPVPLSAEEQAWAVRRRSALKKAAELACSWTTDQLRRACGDLRFDEDKPPAASREEMTAGIQEAITQWQDAQRLRAEAEKP